MMLKKKSDITFEDRDEYIRKPIAEKIISDFKKKDIEASPMLIDGGWGTGKSEFLYKLINLMKEEEAQHFSIIYIDAFTADHANDPLLTILSEIINKTPPDSAKRDSIIKKTIPVLKFCVKTASKAVISHTLRQDVHDIGKDYTQALQKTADKAFDMAVGSVLNNHIEAKRNLELLTSELKNLSEKKQIIVFIDELDRCRPDFALNMIEVIKHTFDIPNISFVLIANFEQLKCAVTHRYGHNVDANDYLDKFIGFKTKLISPSADHFKLHVKQNELKINLIGELIVCYLVKLHNLSFRNVEQICKYALKIKDLFEECNRSYCFQGFLLIGILIREHKPGLLLELRQDNIDAELFADFLGIKSNEVICRKGHVHTQIMYLLLRECNKNKQEYHSLPKDPGLTQEIIDEFQQAVEYNRHTLLSKHPAIDLILMPDDRLTLGN